MQSYYGHKNIRTKKTSSKPARPDQVINESLSFTISARQLEQYNFVVSLMIISLGMSEPAEVEYGRVVLGLFMYARKVKIKKQLDKHHHNVI